MGKRLLSNRFLAAPVAVAVAVALACGVGVAGAQESAMATAHGGSSDASAASAASVQAGEGFAALAETDSATSSAAASAAAGSAAADGSASAVAGSLTPEAALVADEGHIAEDAVLADESAAVENGWGTDAAGVRHWYDEGVMAADKAFYDPGTGAWYWADADGSIATGKDVFIPVSNEDRSQGKWVRFDESSRMVKGEDYRYGGWYYFDQTTGEMAKGFRFVESNGGKWVCYDRVTGQMHHGQANDSGYWYLFDENTGATQYGFQYIASDNKWVFYDRTMGWMLYGEQFIDGNWYYLDECTGAVTYGWKWFSDSRKWVYYDDVAGTMYHGWNSVGGKQLYFDETTGMSATRFEGVYQISNALDADYVLDVEGGSTASGAGVSLWSNENSRWQRFRFISMGDGYYRIAPLHSGLTLGYDATSKKISQQEYTGAASQLWSIEPNSDGSYRFVAKDSGLSLTLAGAAGKSIGIVAQSGAADNAAQHWAISQCSARDSFKIYLDAGHGWGSSNEGQYDPGAGSEGRVEAEMTVEVVEKVAKICQEEYGLLVVANTYGGYYWERHSEAVSMACSTFLSFHFNASASGTLSGVESYIHSYNAAPGSAAWQRTIHPWLVAATGLSDRGMKTKELAVCGGKLPSVLMELGFIDNEYDMSVYDADKVARFIAAGINEAADDYECQA